MAQTSCPAAYFEQMPRKYLRMLNMFSHKTKPVLLSIESFTQTPDSSVTFRFKVIEELYNEAQVLHGGYAVLLVDDMTTVLLGAVSEPRLFSRFGASKNLNAKSIRPLELGDEARIVFELEYLGKRRAVLRASFIGSKGMSYVLYWEMIERIQIL
ncbi:uncharacterized protein N7484_003426 [Penicillium longicatenatum]|uniref:uncharacterized protein n=1 Tax=Penicillium longicatenatum TaxID=1561947 RepID=UPI0025467BA0|nr:uncharacterized protein N7484_003426 [Penicillium longicatenatum]KAJ5649703.1 hypothetical protein N7484_003426 [Penicillium longicatenatum]